MAEALKRWDGEQWVTVATVNRIVVQEGGSASPLPTIQVYAPLATNDKNLSSPIASNPTVSYIVA